ncbi:MAG: hypothetical protein Q4A29_07800, partial [Eubacteriales bacterium]|nr:hypothetical protein [Eubacteriales bacterium]
MKIKTIKKLVPVLIWILVFSFSVTVILATDNADSGNNASQSAVAGFYRSRDWMYKVSIYVGKSDTTKPSGSIKDFHLVGQPIFIAPTTLSIPANRNVYASPYNKMQYLSGKKLSVFLLGNQNIHNFSGVPAIPIINKGHINAVKQYFGDTESLIALLDEIAKVRGTTKEALLTANAYTIGGNARHLSAEEILPVKGADGKYKNLVPYLVVYEPVAIGYLTDGKTALAFTATEYAIAQKDGLMNFFTKSLGKVSTAPQLMWGLTHRDLPNSIFLEESWLGLPARAEVANRKATSQWTKSLIDSVSDTIIKGSGIGMRFLNAASQIPNSGLTSSGSGKVVVYKTGKEVITSVKVSSEASTNRIDRFHPNSPAEVVFTINGVKKTHKVIMPDGGEQYAWVKWRTPDTPGKVHVSINLPSGMVFSEGSGANHRFLIYDIVDVETSN